MTLNFLKTYYKDVKNICKENPNEFNLKLTLCITLQKWLDTL